MNRLLLAIAVCLFASPAFAQTPPVRVSAQSRFAWDQPAPTEATDAASALAIVKAYTIKRYSDGSTTGLVMIGVVCTAKTPPATDFLCVVPVPAYTLGGHTISMTASIQGDPLSESPKSLPFSFTMSATATTPGITRLTPSTP